MKFKMGGSFKDAITIDSDGEDEVPLKEPNITFLEVVKEEATVAPFKRAQKEGESRRVSRHSAETLAEQEVCSR
jgi:hypothetical protein